MGELGTSSPSGGGISSHVSNISFITCNSLTLNLLQLADRIATSDVSVLIQGESGTGKELVAKRIHERSSRKNRLITSLNCGAIHETLLLSELFGYEKGAFTGAATKKQGLVEAAAGGTLFLDEIGEMGLEAQAKLLRFLQNGEIYRVGGRDPIHVDVRILSATNKELEQQVKHGKFREDLYYRINTVTLRIAPLRKRPEDVPLLVDHFLRKRSLGGDKVKFISPRAVEILRSYPWPGNVRELQNLVERLKILSDSETITEADIPFNLKNPVLNQFDHSDEPATFLLSEIEKRHILKVLIHFNGNKTRAAQAMGITVKTLYNKLAIYEAEKEADSATGVSENLFA